MTNQEIPQETTQAKVTPSSRVRDENFYAVFGWMLKRMHLRGNELIVYSVIYAFSQDGESEFTGSTRFLQEFANIRSQQTVITTLKNLERKSYILRREYLYGNVPRVAYRANIELVEARKHLG